LNFATPGPALRRRIDFPAPAWLDRAMKRPSDGLAAAAALMGAGGVMLAAASTHAGGGELGRTASEFLMLHAGALLGVSAAARPATPRRARRLLVVGGALALGVILFAADLCARGFFATKLFPLAAPTGGSLTILSWLALVVVFLLAE
jgi:uncharacterized membrane protein YgdD (TMEM256/DUF423 family)